MKQNGIFTLTFAVGLVLFVLLYSALRQNNQSPTLRTRAQLACTGTVVNGTYTPCSNTSSAVDTQVACLTYTCDDGTTGVAGDCTSGACFDAGTLKAEAVAACQASCAASGGGGGGGPVPPAGGAVPTGSSTIPTPGTGGGIGTPPGGSACNSALCDFNNDGVCYDSDPADQSLINGVILRGLCNINSGATAGINCSALDVNKDGVVDNADIVACVASCAACSGGPTPTTATYPSPTIMCKMGIESPIIEDCPVPTTPPSSVINTTPIVPPAPQMMLKGMKCVDGTIDTTYTTTSCVDKSTLMSMLETAMKDVNVCAGAKTPGCLVPTKPVSTPTEKVNIPFCSTKSIGDCNCNGTVDIIDFECWRKQYNNEVACSSADFNGNGACQLSDFELLRKNLFK